jgi:uncharacterized protein YdaU (DUF1376 family)
MMVAWYKHDIPAWMDGTESLDAEPYRAYHVICQLIYMNEGPIALNEHGIAGRCKQSVRTFRAALKVLLDSGKLTLDDGRLNNSRAEKELENVSDNRVNAGKGGQKSGEVRKSISKPLKSKKSDEASLQDDRSLKTRLEETREEKKECANAPLLAFDQPDVADPAAQSSINAGSRKIKTDEADLFDRGKAVLGKTSGGLIKKLLNAKGGNIALARAAVEQASTKSDPREYLGAIIRGRDRDGIEVLGVRGEAG